MLRPDSALGSGKVDDEHHGFILRPATPVGDAGTSVRFSGFSRGFWYNGQDKKGEKRCVRTTTSSEYLQLITES